MAAKIGGKNFDVNLGDLLVHIETGTLTITDSSTVAQTKGVPNGHVDGSVAAAGELEMDTSNFNLLIDQARAVGSFRELEPFDIVFFAQAGDDALRVEAFGCRVRVSSLLDLKASSSDKSLHKVPFDVTSPDFVKINGVPYLGAAEIEGLI